MAIIDLSPLYSESTKMELRKHVTSAGCARQMRRHSRHVILAREDRFLLVRMRIGFPSSTS
jgi:hypothetical protein